MVQKIAENVTYSKFFWTISYGMQSKVILVLFLTEHHDVKMYWGNGGIAPHILDLGIRWR
jgi:hypothetical protein